MSTPKPPQAAPVGLPRGRGRPKRQKVGGLPPKRGAPRKISIPDGHVEPFPRRRFMDFVSRLKVQTRDYGLVPLEFLGSQLYVLDEIEKGMNEGITTFMILKARQLGISTLFLALDLFWAFEHSGLLGIFATHDEGSRDQFRNQIEVFLQALPQQYKVNAETNNRLMLVLENSSLFRYLVAGGRTTTNKLGRSGGCNFCHATEVAFWGSGEDIKAMMQTFSELYPYRGYFFETTANGYNHFADMWETALESPAQCAIFVGWWRDERNEFYEGHPLYLKYMPEGVKSPLTPLERERVRAVKEIYDFGITAGQIGWYRFHLETKCGGDQQSMDEEMPWTAEMAFVATGSHFFEGSMLTAAMKEARQEKCKPYIVRLTNRFDEVRAIACDIRNADLKIWEMPVEHGRYVLGADPIFGSSPDSDTGVISVFRCYADGCDQVAEFASPTVTTFQFAWTLAFLAGLYSDSYLVLEMLGPGTPVFEELGQLKQKLAGHAVTDDTDIRNCLKHMKNFLYRRADSLSGGVLLQWQTSERLREQMLERFKIGMEDKRVRIRSMRCLEECKFLVRESDGHIGAPPSKHDDRVFGAGLAYMGWDKMVRKRMLSAGSTREKERERDQFGDANDPVGGLVKKWMANAKITVDAG